MSRSLIIELKEAIAQRLNSSFEAEFRHIRMLSQRIEHKRLGVLPEFQIPAKFSGMIGFRGVATEGLNEQEVRSSLTSEQKAGLLKLSRATNSLGFRGQIKAIPYLGQPIAFEFFKPKEEEKIPLKQIGGRNET
jgi:hypothetical protein